MVKEAQDHVLPQNLGGGPHGLGKHKNHFQCVRY